MEDILILIRNTFISWLVVFVLNWIVEKIKNYLEKIRSEVRPSESPETQ